MGRNRRHWTHEEDQLLRQAVQLESCELLAVHEHLVDIPLNVVVRSAGKSISTVA